MLFGSSGSDVAPNPDVTTGHFSAEESIIYLLFFKFYLHREWRCTGHLTMVARDRIGDRFLLIFVKRTCGN